MPGRQCVVGISCSGVWLLLAPFTSSQPAFQSMLGTHILLTSNGELSTGQNSQPGRLGSSSNDKILGLTLD